MLQRNWQVNKQKVAGEHFGTHNAKIKLGEFKTYRDVKEKRCRGKQRVTYLTSRMDDRTSITKRKTGSCGGLWSWKEGEENRERERDVISLLRLISWFCVCFDICCLSDKIGSTDFLLKAKFIYSFQMSRKPGTKKLLKKNFMNFCV